ncbi:MAG TPA: superoxide dismutase, partial [Acidimicrobiia bacterium]
VVELSPDFASGTVVDAITDDDFDIPTTVAEFGNSLYAVNARFTTAPGPSVEYDVVRVGK